VERASAGLEKVVGDALNRVPSPERALLAWPLACGSVVAARTRASSFAGGVLTVEVADAGWQRELRALAGRYLASINRYSGQRVERVEFVLHK
jgi:hypothetical protein